MSSSKFTTRWRVHSAEEILWCGSAGDTAKLAPNTRRPKMSGPSFSVFILASRLNRFIFNFLLTELIDYSMQDLRAQLMKTILRTIASVGSLERISQSRRGLSVDSQNCCDRVNILVDRFPTSRR
jgi:hypothetical protein